MAVLGVLVAGLAVTAAVGSGARQRALPPAPPANGAGSPAVTLSPDAGQYPGAAVVRDQLQRHFDAINARDYAAWKATVGDRRAAQQSETAWRADYATTTDGSIRIDRIDKAADGALLVRLRFVSTQSIDDKPGNPPGPRLCWTSTFPFEGVPPRIGIARGADASLSTPC